MAYFGTDTILYQQVAFRGTAQAGSGATTVVDANLVDFEDDFFNDKFYIKVLHNTNSVGNAPEFETRLIEDYATATGTFTVQDFSAAVETGDPFEIIPAWAFDKGGLGYTGKCGSGMAGSLTTIVVPSLSGFGNDYFNTIYKLQIVKNADGVGTVPEGEIVDITDYVSSTGTFTIDTLSVNAEEDDDVIILHKDAILIPKQKVFMGINGQVPLNEYFGTVGGSVAPDTAIWTVVEDNDASVQVFFSTTKGCLIIAGTVAANDGYMFTRSSRNYDPTDSNIISLSLKTRLKVTDLTGEFGFGFMDSDNNTPTADTFDTAAQHHATIHCDNDIVNFSTSEGTNETTDVSAQFSDNTLVIVEIVITASDVKLYTDGTLRATHSTRVPTNYMYVAYAAKNTNGITTGIIVRYNETWPQ